MEPEFSICLALKLVCDSIMRFTATPPNQWNQNFGLILDICVMFMSRSPVKMTGGFFHSLPWNLPSGELT